MNEALAYRDYQDGDEYQIAALFNEVFQRDMALAYWRWRFLENPFGKLIVRLLFDGDRLIGHYAVVPMNVEVLGEPLKAAFSMTTMTHPEYTGRGIFAYLAEETYKKCQQQGFNFVYGFPNRNSYYGFTHKVGWKGLGKMTTLQKKTERGVVRQSTVGQIQQIEQFDERADSLWNKVGRDYSVIVPRTAEFLNWRFSAHPEVNYPKYIFIDKKGHLLGYIVLKMYVNTKESKGHIVDILSVRDRKVIKVLLDHSYSYFEKRNANTISCWVPRNTIYYDILLEEGFRV